MTCNFSSKLPQKYISSILTTVFCTLLFFFSRAPIFRTLPSICFFSKDALSIKYLSNKISYVHLLIKVFFEGKIIDYFEYLFAEHALYYKHIVRRGGKPPILRKHPISENLSIPTHPIST